MIKAGSSSAMRMCAAGRRRLFKSSGTAGCFEKYCHGVVPGASPMTRRSATRSADRSGASSAGDSPNLTVDEIVDNTFANFGWISSLVGIEGLSAASVERMYVEQMARTVRTGVLNRGDPRPEHHDSARPKAGTVCGTSATD